MIFLAMYMMGILHICMMLVQSSEAFVFPPASPLGTFLSRSTSTTLPSSKSKFNQQTDYNASSSSFSSIENLNEYSDMPWGDRQRYALIDNIQKYLVEIPQLPSENGSTTYVMWRSMMKDNIELVGYDAIFLRKKCAEMIVPDPDSNDHDSTRKLDLDDVPGILPLLDQFEFAKNGGVSGKIQGLRGIADGTTVQTSPVMHLQLTVPRGYVLTEDGKAAYELGEAQNSENFYSLDFSKMSNIGEDDWKKALITTGAKGTGRVISKVADISTNAETTNMLVNVGASTVTLLGAATLINMVSHHMTVNVFWV